MADATPDPALGAQWCFWLWYVEEQAIARACQLPRSMFDDAVDAGLAHIEDFIVAKSQHPPITPAEMSAARKVQEQLPVEFMKRADGGLDEQCKNDQQEWLLQFRQQSLDALEQNIGLLTTRPSAIKGTCG
ncbi:MAG: hypothetical protein ACTHOR_03515 [Devosia sp.]